MIIGIDLGGTKITGAVFSPWGTVRCKQSALLEQRQGTDVGRLVRAVITQLIASSEADGGQVEAIGACVPGITNSKTGTVWAPNIPGWEDYPLQQELEAAFRPAQVHIASDRTCCILGESWKGAAQGCNNALFLAVGTGIGLGILADGRILHGHGDIAGATGWMALGAPYRETYKTCGCFETYASGNGIARQAQLRLKDGRYTKTLLRKKAPETITAEDVFCVYNRNNKDALAGQVMDKAIAMWGMAAANLVSLFNPEKIIWGGGVFGPATQYLQRIYEEAARWAQPVAIRQVRFEPSRLGGDAGLYGAGNLALMNKI
ncbi:MAG: ROK family protein [Prevotellaceae bacterium]|jgi:glucokinase|nr:ROK family protein [Prevotellaceae bacterium]